jgi:pimeloyl-ACP methyl ester carboxylesterase
VSRAAALLALIRPQQLSRDQYRAATEEARELLAVEPIDQSELGREELVGTLADLGEAGARSAELMRTWAVESDERTFGPGPRPASSTRVAQELRERSDRERVGIDAAQREAAEDLFQDTRGTFGGGRAEPAARLIATSLLDEDSLVRVAAAAAALRVDRRNPVAEAILDDAARRESDEIAELSRTILTTDRESDTRRIEIEDPSGLTEPTPDSALIHGTWARRGRWWRPDGALARYLIGEGLFPHLYRGRDPFRWSGYFSFRAWAKPKMDWHRRQAGDSLAWWAHRRLETNPDLIGHSYGGSLAMLATQAEKQVRGMVLLSPAVHRTCLPDPAHYEQIVHVTTKLDLVLLADLSTPQLLRSLPNVTQWPVKRRGLTGHAGTHDPAAWDESGLAAHLHDVWLPSLSPRN